MSKYVLENLGAPGKYMSTHGLDTVNEEGRRLCICDNPSDEETQFYIFSTGNGVYTIANVKSKKCVNVSRHDRSNGGAVFQWDNPGSLETQFKITHHKGDTDKGDYYNIESVYVPNTCINVTGNQTENGSKLILYNNPHAWSTQWYIRSVSGGAFDPNETVSPDLETFLGSKGYGPYVPNETFQDSKGYVPVVPEPVKPVAPPVTPAVPGVPLYYVDAPESARTYSSIYKNEKPGVGHGRSILGSHQAWSALNKKAGEWMQIDMGQVLTVAGTVVQGRKDLNQYVSTYTVATSVDGKNFTNVTGEYNGQRGTVKNLFTDGTTIKARYVRIYVKTFYQHPSMRADILVTEGIIDGKAAVPGVPLYYSNPPESARTYSSIWVNDKPGVKHGRSCLNSPQAWSAGQKKAGEWMQIDMGEVLTVAGTVVQGRKDLAQYVSKYTVATSVDGKNFTNVTGEYNGQRGTVKNLFTDRTTIKARYVRIYVKTYSEHPSMRAAVLVTDSVISEEIPAVTGVPLYYSNAPESARTYSSIWVNDKPGVKHGRSCLNSPQAWSAGQKKAGEWMQIDMGQVLHGRRHCCPRSKGPRAIRVEVHGGNQCGRQELFKRDRHLQRPTGNCEEPIYRLQRGNHQGEICPALRQDLFRAPFYARRRTRYRSN